VVNERTPCPRRSTWWAAGRASWRRRS